MPFCIINNKCDLFNFFDKNINIPKCDAKTRAYIVSIFSDLNPEKDLSKESVTLLYNKALSNYNFELFKDIGDWLFVAKSLFPDALSGASPKYYSAIAQSSYYKCYIIMNRQWLIFEELADKFNFYTENIKLDSSKGTNSFM